MPVNCASWSITTIPSSASAGNLRCLACLNSCSTTGPHRCVNRYSGSWTGLTLSTWKIRAAVAAGWWTTCSEKRSRSAVTGCETSCAPWIYGRSTRNANHLSRKSVRAVSLPHGCQQGQGCGSALSESNITNVPLGKDSSAWWRS